MRKLITKLKSLELIKTKKQRDNWAKYSYDMSKIVFLVAVFTPIVKHELFNIYLFSCGLLVGIMLFIFGSLLDRKEE